MIEEVRTSVSMGNVCAYHVVDGRIATADANLIGENIWWISRVFVPDFMRGSGIGSAILNRLADEVLKNGGTELVVCPGGYFVDGERQRKFYLKNDFKETDVKEKLIRKLK